MPESLLEEIIFPQEAIFITKSDAIINLMRYIKWIIGRALVFSLFISISFFSAKMLAFTAPAPPSDSTPPVVSLVSPISSEATSTVMTLAATATDNVAISVVYFYIDDVLQGSGDNVSPYYLDYDTTNLSNEAHTAFAVARDSSSNSATSSVISFTVDNTPLIVSAVSAVADSDSATINWTTDDLGSSLVDFGLTANYGTSTSETDIVDGTQSHSVLLNDLTTCTQYHYKVRSKDTAGNITYSSDGIFDTVGCTGNVEISSLEKEEVTVSSGASIVHDVITLTVPSSFTAATSSATLQVAKLDSDFFETAGGPSGKASVGSAVFNLKAFADANTTISNFDEPITVTMSYLDSDILGIEESSLRIYRYDSSVWTALSDCSVNIENNIVSCVTSDFSDFAIFGDNTVAGAVESSGSISRRITNLENLGDYEKAKQLADQSKIEKIESLDKKEEINIKFEEKLTNGRDLDLDNWGDDVILLQEFLIENSIGTSTSELKRVGLTGYFGPFTQGALSEFQKTVGIYPNVGYFGPITKKYLKNLEINVR